MDEQPGLFDVTDRRCGSCGTVRPIDMFYLAYEKRRGAKRGGRALGSCRICIREKNQRRLAPRYEILDRIKTEAGCADCGIRDTEHPEIYDFDHLPEFHKVNPVAWFLTHGTIEDMLAEVAKCEVVCSNCHRIRTRRLRVSNSFGIDRGPQRRTAS
jgi:ferredoxin